MIAAEKKTDLKNWATGTGHATPAFNADSKAPADATLVQTKTERPAKMVTNTAGQVAAQLAREDQKELVTPTAKAGNDKDSEPKWNEEEDLTEQKEL